MSGGDEMRAQKITFILCIESCPWKLLWTLRCLESSVLLVRVFQSFISACSICLWKPPTCRKPEVDPGGTGQWIRQMSAQSSFTSAGWMCSPIVWGELKYRRMERWREKGRKKKKNFYMVNSMCPILSCWCYAGAGGRWAGWVKTQSFYARL